MAERELQEPGTKSALSRRQLIRRGMLAGGVALWSAPVVASAAFNRRDTRPQVPKGPDQSSSPKGENGPAPEQQVAAAPVTSCTGYPPGTCITFECLGAHTVCGAGVGIYECFCDVDVNGTCVCRNDAPCEALDSCSSNADCPTGYFCIPTSCCTGFTCAPPCGTLPPGVDPDGP